MLVQFQKFSVQFQLKVSIETKEAAVKPKFFVSKHIQL